MRVSNLFQRSRVLASFLSLLLVLVIGLLDVLTGPDLSFALFYMIPISFVTWGAGKWSGVSLALVSALAWLLADLWHASYLHPLIPFWNTLVRLVFFLLCTLFLSGLKEHRRLELERALEQRAAQEQQRIGQELHDTVMQQMVGTKLLAGHLQGRLETQGSPEAEPAAELVTQLGEGIAQLRRLMNGLVAVEIDPDDLTPALERVIHDFRSWHHLPVYLQSSQRVAVRDAKTARHLVLLVQEALMNATKHARASRVMVSVETTDHKLVLRVSDDGVGLPENHIGRGGLGLQSMRQRAEVIGATLQLSRGQPHGTMVTCTLPDHAPKKLEPEPASGLVSAGRAKLG